MSTKRKSANPMFSKPLTLEEITKIPRQRQVSRPVVCSKCGQLGGTLGRIGDNEYIHIGGTGCNI